MHVSRTFPLALAFTSVLLAPACAGTLPSDYDGVSSAGKIVTADKIASYNVANALEVLQKTGAYRVGRDDGPSGSPNIRSKRGRTSFLLRTSDIPRVILDGARVADLRVLRDIPANTIAWIQLLNGMDGTLFEGTNSGAGVILIVTKAGH